MTTVADADLSGWNRYATSPRLRGSNPFGVSQYPTGIITGYGTNPVDGYPDGVGTTYYLDAVSGDDTAGDGSTDAPWKTLTKILTVMASGDNIIMRDGNYGNYAESNITSRTDWITFRADAGHSPVIAGLNITNATLQDAYARFDGITFSFDDSGSVFGLDIRFVKYFELRNCSISNFNHKYETSSGVYVLDSENILIYYTDITTVSTGITANNSSNVTISRNHIHDIGGGTGIKYATGNDNFIIEKNNIYESNFDTVDIDPNSPYTAGDPAGHPHSGALSVRSADVWIRGNVFRSIGTTAIMQLYPSAAPVYTNVIIENNLMYDSRNVVAIGIFELGTVTIKNNTIIGHVRTSTTNGSFKMHTAVKVHSIAGGYDGSGLLVYNNILGGTAILPDTVVSKNNIFWSYSHYDDEFSFLGTPPDVDTTILTSTTDYPITYFTDAFFTGITSESDFNSEHSLVKDFSLNANSDAVNAGDASTQSELSIGLIDGSFYLQDDGDIRDASHHSIGAYE